MKIFIRFARCSPGGMATRAHFGLPERRPRIVAPKRAARGKKIRDHAKQIGAGDGNFARVY